MLIGRFVLPMSKKSPLIPATARVRRAIEPMVSPRETSESSATTESDAHVAAVRLAPRRRGWPAARTSSRADNRRIRRPAQCSRSSAPASMILGKGAVGSRRAGRSFARAARRPTRRQRARRQEATDFILRARSDAISRPRADNFRLENGAPRTRRNVRDIERVDCVCAGARNVEPVTRDVERRFPRRGARAQRSRFGRKRPGIEHVDLARSSRR